MLPASKIFLFLLVSLTVVSLARSASAQSLQEQAICATQAKKTFQEDKVEQKEELLRGMSLTSDYQNHYNVEMNRCFILEKWASFRGTNIILSDAYEKRMYAHYYYDSGSGQYRCKLTPANGDMQDCKSKDEFSAFVTKYMNE